MKTAHKSQGAEPASARNRRARTAATCSVLLLTALHFAGHLPWLRARAAETLGELRPGGWMPPELTWRLLWMGLAWLWLVAVCRWVWVLPEEERESGGPGTPAGTSTGTSHGGTSLESPADRFPNRGER